MLTRLLVVTFFCTFIAPMVIAQQISDDGLIYPVYEDEYIPDVTYDTIEARLKRIENVIPLNLNDRVKAFIDYFTIKDREYTQKVMRRRDLYFPIFEEILAKHNLPDELKYLSIVESGLVAQARSRAAAVGLWQFIYTTGKYFDLEQGWYIDERMDPYASTEAACKFLKSLHNQFGEWELALAAYNCGPGNVRRAIRRSGYKKSFWEIYRYLPRETRSYVPQFVAITYTFNYAEDHLLQLDPWEYDRMMETDTVMLKGFAHLESIGEYLDICIEDLEKINTGIKNRAIPENNRTYILRLPSDKKPAFNLHRDSILLAASIHDKDQLEKLARNASGSVYGRERVVHRVRSGEVLGTIAQKYRVRVRDLRAWNNLHGNLIRVGQRLNVYVRPDDLSATRSSNSYSTKANAIDYNGKKVHVVRQGDTLWSISRAYNDLTIEKIKKLNNLESNKIKPGQKLVIG
ncbi:MAG TPA: lytic transglycosylase [Cytophagales bacterium]|jgi:membrane-bound lytic murein transglycosylase D|nr:lytic transglycosylase [Cytophagales bacterium]